MRRGKAVAVVALFLLLPTIASAQVTLAGRPGAQRRHHGSLGDFGMGYQ